MRHYAGFVFRLFLFWIFFFLFFRTLLFGDLWFHKDTSIGFYNLLQTWCHGFRLDAATASYILILPAFLAGIYGIYNSRFIKSFIHYYNFFLIVLFTVLSIANIIIMREWGTQLNYRALSFITSPREMLASVTTIQLLFFLVAIIIISFCWIKCYTHFVVRWFEKLKQKAWVQVAITISTMAILAVFSRGGMQQIPINESSAAFSQNQTLNQIASNNIWYLFQNVIRTQDLKTNPYVFLTDSEAEKNVSLLYNAPDSTTHIFSPGKHNIVLLLLESHTADVIEELGGDSGVCPNISSLIKEGLLFSNIYSSGARTDEMLASVFSGFPAQPYQTIIRFSEKTAKLPSLLKPFTDDGYSTSFYYGGELNFSNMKNYLLQCGFQKLTGKESFADNSLKNKWGAHDGFVLTKQLIDLNKQQQPFFSTLLTLSLHDPYESPEKSPFNTNTDAGLFKNVAWYTDKSLGYYFTEAKKQSWYNNTIFILMADHGNRLVRNRSFFDTGIRHIPLIIFGEPLKKEFSGTRITVTGNQHDLPSTLLHQFGYDAGRFSRSNNLLNTHRHNFAYLCMDDATGWVTDTCTFVYDMKQNKLQSIYPNNCHPQIVTAKSYLQLLYEQFLNL